MTQQTALAVSYPTHVSELFEPVKIETFADLVVEHDAQARRMNWLADMVMVESDHDGCDVLHHFAEGNNLDGAEAIARRLFGRERGLKALASSFWRKAMSLTDCYEEMIADDKRKWDEMLKRYEPVTEDYGETVVHPAVPDFTAENIQATFSQLIADRSDSFAKRVDGVFKALSPDHVTNRPQGFGSKLILANLLESGRYSFGRWSDFEYLRDLRRVIGTFMGRGRYDQHKSDLHEICKRARDYNHNSWVWIDGNSWAIKAFHNGNVHVKLHPEMVYRLNMVLASLYPQALAPEALRKPKRSRRKSKAVQLEAEVLSFAAVAFLRDHTKAHETGRGTWRVTSPDWRYRELNKVHRQAYERVMAHLGGVEVRGGWEFDYCPLERLQDVTRSGVVPERQSHQFYPTPPSVAELVAEAAELYEGCSVLEPSAGTGNLIAAAKKAIKGCTFVAVEAAELHAKVLEGRFRRPDCGGSVEVWHEDFLVLDSQALGGPYDRVIMNPPFNEGRAEAHVRHAATMVRLGGRLVAVVPPGLRGLELDGFDVREAHELPSVFDGTSITTHILVAERVA